MEYITTKEASKKWGISTSRITLLANEGRIPGAQRLGRSWLIPASATKPVHLIPNHSKAVKRETGNFSFPLYHFRPDWSYIKDSQLSLQQRELLLAETAVLECRFADAYTLIKSVLHSPDDIAAEVGGMWVAGICCVALNKADEFSAILLRLNMLLSENIPHRNDFKVILDFLNTYVIPISSATTNISYDTDIHDQCIPLVYMLIGYAQLTREVTTPDSADTTILELGLRLLQSTGSLIVIEMIHIYLMGIYSLRFNMDAAEKHAEIAVRIAYENKLYFPLVTYYNYNAPVLSPILESYPAEFQKLCNELSSQYNTNFSAFLSSICRHSVISKLNDEDSPYILATLIGLPNTAIAEKTGLSQQSINRKLSELYKKFGVKNKKELKDYLQKYL